MKYIFGRALVVSIVLYISTFVIDIIAALVSGQDMSSMANIPESFWYVRMVTAVILAGVFSSWYFKGGKVHATASNGLYFGITAVAISFVLDVVFFALENASGAGVDMSVYFGDYRYWVIVALVVLTAVLVGQRKCAPKLGM